MSMTDPIADLITRIRNASMAGHKRLAVPSTQIKREIVRVMLENHYLRGYANQAKSPQDQLLIRLRYTPTQGPVLTGLRRISKPGLRRYATRDEIKTHNRRMGLTIVSTSRGVMSGEEAVGQGIGGELLCEVW